MDTFVEEQLPTPLGNISDLLEDGDTSATPYKVFIGHNLGERTFLTSIPIHEFYKISEVANKRGDEGEPIAQRKLDVKHAKKLAVYILKGLLSGAIIRREAEKKSVSDNFIEIQKTLGSQPYISLQPIVTNIRTCKRWGENLPGKRLFTTDHETAGFKVFLSQKDVLWVIDGQHRRKAMQMVFEFLDYVKTNQKYPGKKNSLYEFSGDGSINSDELIVWEESLNVARTFCTIMVEIHLGLSPEKERQLFHDLNNLGKKVETSLALQFDNSNPLNIFIKEVLLDDILEWELVEKDIVNWQDDVGSISRKDLVSISARLFLNKGNISGATPPMIEPKKEIACRFWEEVQKIPFIGKPKAKLNTVAAQPVALKALAKLIYDSAFGRHPNEESLKVLLSGLKDVDFSHENPMWRFYQLSEEERTSFGLDSLKGYLPSDEEGYNRDLGGYDPKAKIMRFGPKHNDIYPILGDMIRWKLSLPTRN